MILVPEIRKTELVQLLIETNHASKIRRFNGLICKDF